MTEKKRTIAGLLGRSLMVIVAFTLAALLAAIVLMLLGSYSMGEELRDGYQPDGEMAGLVSLLSMVFGGASFLMFVTPTLTILPALVAVIVAEVIQVRSLLYYLIAGGLSVTALPLLASPENSIYNPHYLAIFATAGFVGGMFYWLMAGRNA